MNRLRHFLTDARGRTVTDLLVLAILFSVAFFHSLGAFPLMDPDEGRYAEIPREMIASGDFVTPHFNDAKFFDKPPLFYWMNAASFMLFGANELGARVPSALCGFLTVLLTYVIGRSLMGRRVGMVSALVLATSGGYLVCSRLSIIDMPLVLFMEAALGCFLLASQEGARRKALLYYLFYVFMALAVLTKGPIGAILPALIIFLYFLFAGRWRTLREMRLPGGIAIFLLICAPWFILVSMRNPGFARYFFFREHVLRFLSPIHRREEPFWFFLPVFIGMLFPWSFFFPLTARHLWIRRREEGFGIRLFLLIWVVVIIGFFSLSKAKLVTYILPSFPAAALLVGAALSAAFDAAARSTRWQMIAVSISLYAIGLAGIFYPWLPGAGELSPLWCLLIGAVAMAGGIIALPPARRGDTAGSFCAVCGTLYAIGLLGVATIPSIFIEERSTKSLALAARRSAGPDTVIASYMFEPSLAFYTERRFVLVDVNFKGELEFGSTRPGVFDMFITVGRLMKMWDSPRHIIAMMKDEDAEWLRGRVTSPVSIIARQGDRVMATNRPPTGQ